MSERVRFAGRRSKTNATELFFGLAAGNGPRQPGDLVGSQFDGAQWWPDLFVRDQIAHESWRRAEQVVKVQDGFLRTIRSVVQAKDTLPAIERCAYHSED